MILRDEEDVTVKDEEQMAKMIAHFKLDMEKLRQAETWRELDEHFTIKVHP